MKIYFKRELIMNIAKIKRSTKSFLILGILFLAGHAYSQDWAKTIIRNQQRVDLRDLGYPMVNEIPINSSAITSLLTARGIRIMKQSEYKRAHSLFHKIKSAYLYHLHIQ